ncbi:HDOD domain-containing protein [Pseudomaricurvus alkylphenolicus]|uniref:HDOD domain-containing protein n=1 Tax=Pseudomaricurvus alkylphenolicus TaxID=1306991 RepID=UPI001423536C|nr:HDOD domain-containing protein [Pseudomaricurvus alkylphenolicus]
MREPVLQNNLSGIEPRVVDLPEPPGLAKLKQQLADLDQLPILAETFDTVLAALHHPNATADNVAAASQSDGVLQLRLITQANRVLKKNNNEVRHLAHAVSLMGLPQVEKILRSAPRLSRQQQQTHAGYLEVLTQSDLAAGIMAGLTQPNASGTEAQVLATLFLRVPEWALWHHYPEHMQTLQGLQANGRQLRSVLETKVFGVTLWQLSNALFPHWPLPTLAQQAWQHQPKQFLTSCGRCLTLGSRFSQWLSDQGTVFADESSTLPAQIEHRFYHPSSAVIAANEVAAQGALHWSHRHSLRAQRLLSRISRIDQDRVLLACRRAAVNTRMPYEVWPHLAHRLLQDWDYRYITPPLIGSPQTDLRPKTVPDGVEDELPVLRPMPAMESLPDPSSDQAENGNTSLVYANQPLLKSLLLKLQQRGAQFNNLNQLLLTVVSALGEGAGWQQVVIFVRNDRQNCLRSHYCHGVDEDSPIKHLQLPLNETTRQGLIGQLLQRPASLQINPSNIGSVREKLPQALLPFICPDQTLVMGLFNGSKAVALVMVTHKGVEARQLDQFKQVCRAASQAITAFARKRRQQKAPRNG